MLLNLFHWNMGSAVELIQHVKLVHLLCHLADEKIDIVLCYVQAAMSQ